MCTDALEYRVYVPTGQCLAWPLFNRAFMRAINMKYVSVTAGDCRDIAMEASRTTHHQELI